MQECWEDKIKIYIKYLVYKHIIKNENYFNNTYYLIISTYLKKYGTCK